MRQQAHRESRSGVISQRNWWDYSSWDWLSCVTLLTNAMGMSQFGFTRDIVMREDLTWSREQARDIPSLTNQHVTRQPSRDSPTHLPFSSTSDDQPPFSPPRFSQQTRDRAVRHVTKTLTKWHATCSTWLQTLSRKFVTTRTHLISEFFFFFFFSKISKTALRLNHPTPTPTPH